MTRKLECKVYLYLNDKTVLNSVIIIFEKKKNPKQLEKAHEFTSFYTGVQVFAAMI